jgi:hypothetical protein
VFGSQLHAWGTLHAGTTRHDVVWALGLQISELVAQDLKKTYGLDTTERTADEILKMCKNYNSKYMHLMSNS